MKTTYVVVFDRETDGRLIASVPGIPGCHAYGRSRREAVARVRSALRFYLAELLRQGEKPPLQPRPVTVQISVAV